MQLISAELTVWWLLLLSTMAVHIDSFKLCPGTQLPDSPEELIFACGLPRGFAAEPFLGTAARGSAPPSTFCLAERPDRQVAQDYWEFYSAQLH